MQLKIKWKMAVTADNSSLLSKISAFFTRKPDFVNRPEEEFERMRGSFLALDNIYVNIFTPYKEAGVQARVNLWRPDLSENEVYYDQKISITIPNATHEHFEKLSRVIPNDRFNIALQTITLEKTSALEWHPKTVCDNLRNIKNLYEQAVSKTEAVVKNIMSEVAPAYVVDAESLDKLQEALDQRPDRNVEKTGRSLT